MSKYIDAEAYKAAHKNAYESAMMECGNGDDTKLARRVYEAVIKSVDVFPAADVAEVRHGRWKNGKCSICEADEPYTESGFWIETPYCPNCGASMVNEDD